MDVAYIFLGVFVLFSYLIAIGIGIADYIIHSIALFRIARKREISLPGLAWVPVANAWTFGSVADDFESQKGSKRKFRIILLVLEIVVAALASVFMLVMISTSTYFAFGGTLSVGDQAAFLAIFYITLLPLSYVGIVHGVLKLICLHKIHENIYPEKSIKYLVISLLVPLGYSICLLKNSKRCEEKMSIEP